MGKYLDSTGLSYLWNKVKTNLDEKADITDLSNVVAEEITDITAPGGVDSPTVELIVALAREGLVELVEGKGLSANDYSDEDKAKLTALPTNEQLTIKGYFLGKRGNVNVSGSEETGVTPLLPLNKTYPIVLKNVLARGNAVAVGFYDATGTFISYPEGIENLNGDFTVSADKYPASACFFRVCTEKTGSSYSNGPSIESREGAVSEAIQATLTAAVDEALIAEATAAGAVYNRATGYFELNTLTDITAGQMRVILEWGRYERIYNIANASAYSIVDALPRLRTTIPAVSASSIKMSYPLFNWTLLGLEIIKFSLNSPTTFTVFNLDSSISLLNQTSLVAILDRLSPVRGNIRIGGNPLPKLSTIFIHELRYDINLANLSALSLASLQFMVDNAKNTEAISIKVHPDVYAKLTDTTNAEWYAVAEAAAAKNIAFATTE